MSTNLINLTKHEYEKILARIKTLEENVRNLLWERAARQGKAEIEAGDSYRLETKEDLKFFFDNIEKDEKINCFQQKSQKANHQTAQIYPPEVSQAVGFA